jgi:chemotaxis protein methyltransferase CheR
MTDRECVELLQWALPKLGLRWRGFSNVRGQVCKRLGRRVKGLGLNCAGYRAKLEQVPAELAVLDSLCTVTITRFYRDRAVFDCLQATLLPPLIEQGAGRTDRPLRCWSAGCASGEEPYSLALMFRLGLLPRFGALRFEIVATDLDPGLLERASRACYPPGALRDLPLRWRELGFTATDHQRCLRPELRQGVLFRREDLRERMPAGPFELILCRNLAFTYFDPPLQSRVLGQLIQRLVPGGLLAIGAHERLPEDRAELLPAAGALPLFRHPG